MFEPYVMVAIVLFYTLSATVVCGLKLFATRIIKIQIHSILLLNSQTVH